MLTIIKPIKLSFLNSDDLLELQKMLTELDYNCGKIDGIYGEKTLNAFNQFKTDHKLTNLDEIGPTTVTILQMALKKEFEKSELELPHKNQPALSKPLLVTEINWFNFDSPVSKYFTIGEVSQWSKERIVTSSIHRQNVINLSKELDKIREQWGKPIGVTSWYRPPNVNRRVGGVSNSTHIHGSAVDIYPINGNIWDFQKWLDSRWNKALGWGASRGFTHLDLRANPPRIRWNY